LVNKYKEKKKEVREIRIRKKPIEKKYILKSID